MARLGFVRGCAAPVDSEVVLLCRCIFNRVYQGLCEQKTLPLDDSHYHSVLVMSGGCLDMGSSRHVRVWNSGSGQNAYMTC
jgi:hypothetical protein